MFSNYRANFYIKTLITFNIMSSIIKLLPLIVARHCSFFVLFLLFILPASIQAQTTKAEFLSDIKHAGGIYKIYDFVKSSATPAPEGYKPFYISHYGRHGSRWVQTPQSYTYPQSILSDAHKAKMLTPLGESLYDRFTIVAKDAEGRYGDVTQLGIKEHRGIAERMYNSFPEVFSTKDGRKGIINSRSTVVPRCILSMAANNERLKELNPALITTREASAKNRYLNNAYENDKKDSVALICTNFFKKHFDTDYFLSTIFSNTEYVKSQIENPVSFIRSLYLIGSDLLDIDYLNIKLLDIFSPEELFTLWQTTNMSTYYNCGPSLINGKVAMDSSKILLKDILDCADNAINNGNISADLRFGHDTYIIPLLALMDIDKMNIKESDPEKVYLAWSDFKITPMGTNLQLIFFKNDKTGDVIVKLLHCEKEVHIPVKTDIYPYYHWKDIKSYYINKLTE